MLIYNFEGVIIIIITSKVYSVDMPAAFILLHNKQIELIYIASVMSTIHDVDEVVKLLRVGLLERILDHYLICTH